MSRVDLHEVVVSPLILEIADAERSLVWIARRAAATRLRDLRSWRLGSLMKVVLVAGGLVVVLLAFDPLVFAVALLLTVMATLAPVVHRLARGRVWEAWALVPSGQKHLVGWAVATPHPLDRHTWRLDVVPHPFRRIPPGWVNPLLPHVHYAADVLGVAVESMDPDDRPILQPHGYLPCTTPMSNRLVPHRFPRVLGGIDDQIGSLARARDALARNPYDLTALEQLTEEVFRVGAVPAPAGSEMTWEEAVLRRRSLPWQVARACAACLDGYVENLAIGRLDPASLPGGEDQLEATINRLADCLQATSGGLRGAVEESAHRLAASGGQPLTWAQEMAHLEIDGLLLAGLVATARRKTDVSLGILDMARVDAVRDAAILVRNRARRVRRRAWFDNEKVGWWALAVASDALDLCGQRAARLSLRRAIRKVETNSLRHRVVTVWIPHRGRGAQSGQASRIEDAWSKIHAVQSSDERPDWGLASLSATRLRRIGVSRGAEGLRAKRFRRTLWELTTNLLLLLLVGVAAWLLLVVIVHPPLSLLDDVANWIRGAPGSTAFESLGQSFDFDLSVTPELALTSSLGMLAVVVTAAVAVAVASPRESSIRAWSQDRAWQVFIVSVGYVASTAAVVLALAPVGLWTSDLDGADRPIVVAAMMFALLTAASAVSMSALRTRLATWQQRRRLSLAESRLKRAHTRLGPSPSLPRLIVKGIGCLALCTISVAWFPLVYVLSSDDPDRFLFLYFSLAVWSVPLILLTTLAVVRWADSWDLAGRVAAMVSALLAIVLVAVISFIILFVGAAGLVTTGERIVAFCLYLFPDVLLVVFLVIARVNAFRTGARTGPATFALHLALHLARRNYYRATD